MYGTFAWVTFLGVVMVTVLILALMLSAWAPIFAVLIAIGLLVLGAVAIRARRAQREPADEASQTPPPRGETRQPSGRPASGEGA